jgi:hypothetical protein
MPTPSTLPSPPELSPPILVPSTGMLLLNVHQKNHVSVRVSATPVGTDLFGFPPTVELVRSKAPASLEYLHADSGCTFSGMLGGQMMVRSHAAEPLLCARSHGAVPYRYTLFGGSEGAPLSPPLLLLLLLDCIVQTVSQLYEDSTIGLTGGSESVVNGLRRYVSRWGDISLVSSERLFPGRVFYASRRTEEDPERVWAPIGEAAAPFLEGHSGQYSICSSLPSGPLVVAMQELMKTKGVNATTFHHLTLTMLLTTIISDAMLDNGGIFFDRVNMRTLSYHGASYAQNLAPYVGPTPWGAPWGR